MASTTMATSGERIDYATILPHRTKLMILAGVLMGLFLAALDQTIVATALPAIVDDFNGIALVGWISTGYLLASTATVPIYGKLSDIYGRRAILIWGISVFLLGSVLCGSAGTMIQLIFYRVVQGVGAAALTSTAFAIPADLFVPAERPRYMGFFGAVFGVSSVIGPFLGGMLTDSLGWHWVFYVNIPVGLIALTFVLLKMPRLASGLRAPIDWLGTLLLITAVVPLLLGLTLDKHLHPWGSPLILGLLASAALGTALFLLVELRAPAPIIALNLFRNRTYAIAILASVLNGAAFFAGVLFLSLFMVNVLGTSATTAGSAQIPLMLAFVVGSFSGSALVQRRGRYKAIILAGFTAMLTGFILLTQIGPQSTSWDVAWRMVILGLGLGSSLPLLALAVQNAVPFEQIGMATASRQFFLQLGQAIGAAILGVLLSTSLTAQLSSRLTPIVAELPPPLQSTINIQQLSASGGAGESSSAGPIDFRTRLTAAASRTGALSPAKARSLGEQANAAVRDSFSVSITRIYVYAVWMTAAALLITALWLPEIVLRPSNREPIMPIE